MDEEQRQGGQRLVHPEQRVARERRRRDAHRLHGHEEALTNRQQGNIARVRNAEDGHGLRCVAQAAHQSYA